MCAMRMYAQAIVIVGMLTAGMLAATPQVAKIPSQAAAFLGTWTVTMTAPDEMKGDKVTVRIWDKNGSVAASIQTRPEGPAIEATGVLLDGDMLIFTVSHQGKPPMRENGAPIWATFTLTLDGDSLKLAQTLERSTTIKRGVGRRQ
jgi:hypothetical protein